MKDKKDPSSCNLYLDLAAYVDARPMAIESIFLRSSRGHEQMKIVSEYAAELLRRC